MNCLKSLDERASAVECDYLSMLAYHYGTHDHDPETKEEIALHDEMCAARHEAATEAWNISILRKALMTLN
ncbi:MAG: hypothetical protein LBE22_10530 [Azoarcus sp.]|jgi:hypothetical protein|nr:hypothetical protein [Azoarcus sp.]